ncbi:MAG: trypsin-like peptidase domain-containing protein [Spirochaetaceae bacterium]|nr:trypsin-like peptidase domain-containing protein [Spirochaetaceae bacterium]
MTTYIQRIGTHFLFFLLWAMVFVSCSSIDDPPASDFSSGDFSLERIDNLLENGENLRVVPLVFPRVEESLEMRDRYVKAIDGLEAEWIAARADGDWRRSLIYLRSFRNLDESSVIGDITESDLFLEGVQEYLDSGKTGAAAVLMQTEIYLETLDDDTRMRLAERFDAAGHTSVATALKGGEQPPPPGIEPLVDGTVTVWVNRGIRLVGNVGVPDRGIGSGFFIDPEGYILTNYHVIESEVDPSYQGYSRLYIKLDDESADRIPAKVVGWDRNFDLALLKTEMDVPYVFNFSNDAAPKLGENIKAIGSPGGLARTLTSGTVSAFARSIQPMAGSLQIDVPINPGNSGGPLLNSSGEVIGIVFAGVQDYDGVNFAIPGPYVQQLVPSLYEGGQIELPWFGLSAWDAAGRVEITYVVPGSPAADGGLLPGDRIVSIDGLRFQTIRSIQEYLITRDPATLTSVVWERNGLEMSGYVALGVRPDIPLRAALGRDARENLLTPLFGFTLERISGKGLNQNYRVESVLPGSIADEAGFSEGDSFTLRKWIHDEEYDVVAIQVVLKGRKAGFFESAIQIAAYLDINTVF